MAHTWLTAKGISENDAPRSVYAPTAGVGLNCQYLFRVVSGRPPQSRQIVIFKARRRASECLLCVDCGLLHCTTLTTGMRRVPAGQYRPAKGRSWLATAIGRAIALSLRAVDLTEPGMSLVGRGLPLGIGPA